MFDARKFFFELFRSSNEKIAYSTANNQYLSSVPRFLIEILIFSLLLGLIYILKNNNSLNYYLPLIGIYLVAGYKLLPALQAIATSYGSIKGNQTSLQNIKNEIITILKHENTPEHANVKITNFDSIEFNNINFSHKNNLIFKDINFKIKKNETIGIIGETGSGKSTFIDLLWRLLVPDSGKLKLNNNEILENEITKLQRLISIVPQKINLLDDTIKNNILFAQKYKDEKNVNERINNLKNLCLLDYVDKKDENGIL